MMRRLVRIFILFVIVNMLMSCLYNGTTNLSPNSLQWIRNVKVGTKSYFKSDSGKEVSIKYTRRFIDNATIPVDFGAHDTDKVHRGYAAYDFFIVVDSLSKFGSFAIVKKEDLSVEATLSAVSFDCERPIVLLHSQTDSICQENTVKFFVGNRWLYDCLIFTNEEQPSKKMSKNHIQFNDTFVVSKKYGIVYFTIDGEGYRRMW